MTFTTKLMLLLLLDCSMDGLLDRNKHATARCGNTARKRLFDASADASPDASEPSEGHRGDREGLPPDLQRPSPGHRESRLRLALRAPRIRVELIVIQNPFGHPRACEAWLRARR